MPLGDKCYKVTSQALHGRPARCHCGFLGRVRRKQIKWRNGKMPRPENHPVSEQAHPWCAKCLQVRNWKKIEAIQFWWWGPRSSPLKGPGPGVWEQFGKLKTNQLSFSCPEKGLRKKKKKKEPVMWSIEMKNSKEPEVGHVCSATASRVNYYGRSTLSSLRVTPSRELSVLASYFVKTRHTNQTSHSSFSIPRAHPQGESLTSTW